MRAQLELDLVMLYWVELKSKHEMKLISKKQYLLFIVVGTSY